MRVLFWSELFWPHIGGAEVFAQDLIRSLAGRGHEFTVVTSHSDRALPDEDSLEGTPVHRLPFRSSFEGRLDHFRASLSGVAALEKRVRPDLVHMNAVGPSSVFCLRSGLARRTPLLLTLQQQVLERQQGAGDTLLAELLRTAHRVIGCSGAALAGARALVGDVLHRSEVIWNGVAPPALAPEPLPFSPPRLLCLGRLVPAKGIDTAIAALARVLPDVPGLTLEVAGDGPEREPLRALARGLGVDAHVRFPGWIEPDGVYARLNLATLVLMPSTREGLPVAGLQAALMGRPLIASRVGGLPELVQDGQTGSLVDPGDVDGMAEAIRARLRHPEETRGMGAAARNRARVAFDWTATVDRYDAVYRECSRDAALDNRRWRNA